jgi:hypothetical protein
MIREFHRHVRSNIGDYYCNPSRYFNIRSVNTENIRPQLYHTNDKQVIIGGGGLIHKRYGQIIRRIIDTKPKHLTLWSIGHNYGPGVIRKEIDFLFPKWLFQADLVGIRDWVPGYEEYYVPCVTCMHPSLDTTNTESIHPYVFYLHERKTKDMSVFPGPVMHNGETDMNVVFNFLGSGETVVTNSYHGAYWALLLGKRVITTSWSTKFNYFKYPPALIKNLDEWANVEGQSAPSNYLAECRKINQDFYNRFKQSI